MRTLWLLAAVLLLIGCQTGRLEPRKPGVASTLPGERGFDYEPGQVLWRGSGCRDCRGTGYAGRRGLFELFVMNDELREMILQRKSAVQLLPVAKDKAGLVLLRDEGWRLVRAGHTTLEEVLRATKA